MARSIEPKTVEKYGRFLKIIKDSEGKEIDLNKVMESFHLPRSTAAYAKKFGLIDYKGKQILKANYDLVNNQVQPIVARRLIQQMNSIKKENDERKRLEKAGLQTNPTTPQDAVQEKIEKYSPKIENRDIYTQIFRVRQEDRPKRFKVRLLGVPVCTITPEY
jgi:hypothetical protein